MAEMFDNDSFFHELIQKKDAEISRLKLELDMWRTECGMAIGGGRFWEKEAKHLEQRLDKALDRLA